MFKETFEPVENGDSGPITAGFGPKVDCDPLAGEFRADVVGGGSGGGGGGGGVHQKVVLVELHKLQMTAKVGHDS